ncbi:hypothetical protein [Simkania negevensis]|uniref:Uncharacterized protein n=1 Tax=Simkania negevensis (strain ATCC VR-1471 / DSM 27360 / Z) TaxID=331113 RepID=F8L4W7_SIMNZ|nr:hypothetical protein [Simkania negevensis]CCB88961.1 hypothetical protein SNE_A10840 [Simkania negevensis Z]
MSDAIDAIDGSFEDLIELYQSSHDNAGKNLFPVDEKKGQLAALETLIKEQHRAQENPNQKLATIHAILNDQFEKVISAADKQKALEGILNGAFSTSNQAEPRSFSDPEEKLEQIETIVRDNGALYHHPHEKFAAIEAVLTGFNHMKISPANGIEKPSFDLTELYEASKLASTQEPDPVLDQAKKELLAELQTMVEEQERLHQNPEEKIATIQTILNDEIGAAEKHQVIESVLNGDLLLELNDESPTFDNPEEKLSQIESIVKDRQGLYSNPHVKFASIEALLGDHSKSANPWVQAHNSLGLVEESSRRIIKAEEKRQKELRDLWRTGMDDKAKLYPEMAWDQKKWQYASMAMMGASFAGPWAAGSSNQIAGVIHPLVAKVSKMDLATLAGLIEKGCNMAPDLANNQGSQLIQVGSQTSSLAKKDRETLHDWETQQERQDLETQQQLVQEARQNDTSLKERHLEVIKTLTSMIVGR